MIVKKLIVILIAAAGLSACQMSDLRRNIEDIVINGESTVYAAGYYVNGSSKVPCTWTGADKIDLPYEGSYAIATGVFVFNSQVFASGTQYYSGAPSRPCYWIGGAKTNLLYNSFGSGGFGNAIFVYNNVAYVAGQDDGLGCYWVNYTTQDFFLPAGTPSCAKSIFVDDTGIYSAGWITFASQNACYWKNKDRTDLYAPGINQEAASIYRANQTTYTAGSYTGTSTVAMYWTGTSGTEISTPSATATSVVVHDGVVYVGGYFTEGGVTIPCYWRNGELVRLTGMTGYSAKVNAITVFHGFVYAAGSFSTGSDPHPCYWKNGQLIQLSSDLFGSANAIFVTSPRDTAQP